MKIDVFTNPVNQALAKIAVLSLVCTAAAFAQHNEQDLKPRVLAQTQSARPANYAASCLRPAATAGARCIEQVIRQGLKQITNNQ